MNEAQARGDAAVGGSSLAWMVVAFPSLPSGATGAAASVALAPLVTGRPPVMQVMPEFNEERSVAAVLSEPTPDVDRILGVGDGWRDASYPDTPAWVGSVAAHVDVLPRARHGGMADGLMSGFAHRGSLVARGRVAPEQVVVNPDTDRRHDPAETPRPIGASARTGRGSGAGVSGTPWRCVVPARWQLAPLPEGFASGRVLAPRHRGWSSRATRGLPTVQRASRWVRAGTWRQPAPSLVFRGQHRSSACLVPPRRRALPGWRGRGVHGPAGRPAPRVAGAEAAGAPGASAVGRSLLLAPGAR